MIMQLYLTDTEREVMVLVGIVIFTFHFHQKRKGNNGIITELFQKQACSFLNEPGVSLQHHKASLVMVGCNIFDPFSKIASAV